MFSLIGLAVVLIAGFLLFKYFTGKSKKVEQRSAMESIACSVFTIWRKNTEDAAKSIRTVRVIRDEALQEVNDAIRSLNDTYLQNMTSLRTTRKTLEETTIPNLRNLPGNLEAKAKESKKKYLESVESGHPIEAYKQTSYKYLNHKKQALLNIEKAEKTLEKISITIETESANYHGRMADLEMIKVNIECTVDIPQVELNSSLSKIRSLQDEITSRMDEGIIRAEVENEMRGSSVSDGVVVSNSELDAEFEKL